MSRRGQGEGSIYRRQDGRWAATISLSGGRRTTFYGKTRQEVARKLNDALKARQDGQSATLSRQKLGGYLEAWLTTVRPTVRPSTWKNDLGRVRNHITPAIGHIPVSKLTPADVEELMQRKLDAGLSPQTVIHLRGILRRALGRAVRHGLVTRNVAQLAAPPRMERVKPADFYDPDEARAFLRAAAGDRLEALWVIFLCTGLRRGEALGLRWQDLDLVERTYSVSQALQRIDGKLGVVENKTTKSRRTGDLPALAVEALQRHRNNLSHSVPLPTAFVFTSSRGTPIEPRNVNTRFTKLLRQAELRPIRLHDLRHSFGSLLLASGATAREVMELLGHSNIGVTMNIYAHVIPALKRQAVDRLDALLRDAR